jgi:hypothetical protein
MRFNCENNALKEFFDIPNNAFYVRSSSDNDINLIISIFFSTLLNANVTVVKINLNDVNASSLDIGKAYSVMAAPTTIFIHISTITDRFTYPGEDVDLGTLLNAVEKAQNSP